MTAVCDVLVVGAGLSGLVCARRLSAGGARVIVLEAQPRVGGRLLTAQLAGAPVDLGGTWMSAGQQRLAALARELDVASFAERRRGSAVLDEPGGLWTHLRRAFTQLRAMRRIERAARAIPLDAPATAPYASKLDAVSLEDWLAREVADPIVRDRIALHADLVLAADRSTLSLLHYLVTLGATGGFGAKGPELPGGGREHRFVGGAQRLALRLAEELGDAVHLDEPVVRIELSGAAARVHTAAATYTADHVVLALPPALARNLDVELPAPARALAAASSPGAVVKCVAAYERPFWREQGRSGEIYQPRGAVRATVDATAPDGPATLLAFVVGPEAVAWRARSAEDRRAEVLATLTDKLGAVAAHPVDYLERDWSADPWSAGCVACLPTNVLSTGAAWRSAHGRLHFAGTESAVSWPGYMEGAIEAGERAAEEILGDGPVEHG
ncbi:MAG: FAD-dependent oxidoreductase [Kofleriaceae bacterium]